MAEDKFKFSKLVTNKTKEDEGIWCPVGAGFEVKVARLGNQKYKNFLRRLGKPHARSMRAGTADPQIVEDITRRAVARHVLLDWRGLHDDDESVIEYSEAKALELITQSADFYEIVLEAAQDMGLFKDEDEEEIEGN